MNENEIYKLLLDIENKVDEALNHYNLKSSPSATIRELKQIDLIAQKTATLQKWARL